MLGRWAIKLIKLYQRRVSPFKPPSCKYYPTCSQYAIEAIQIWGFFRGIFLAIWRILRCNPFSRGGYDPVPTRDKESKD
ncbi:MAG: membrane protein insertion efficiency factor YidD [Clostridiaceae bacterium]|jgi:putative membrane protein insertion efficiency factor|nr:membrane protein insertion efficiency factor YidD [Bacillota bacterium]NLN51589.1 membrane protein insertion efficiency factor YidD [Clostridiaceae bacterium]